MGDTTSGVGPHHHERSRRRVRFYMAPTNNLVRPIIPKISLSAPVYCVLQVCASAGQRGVRCVRLELESFSLDPPVPVKHARRAVEVLVDI